MPFKGMERPPFGKRKPEDRPKPDAEKVGSQDEATIARLQEIENLLAQIAMDPVPADAPIREQLEAERSKLLGEE